jgi:hypothetical protein
VDKFIHFYKSVNIFLISNYLLICYFVINFNNDNKIISRLPGQIERKASGKDAYTTGFSKYMITKLIIFFDKRNNKKLR